ncbi:hypothetical protein KVR01_006591 [Diaporthe batatas]|uniref:uncharacterized protein n=1 Tax=Diaporthe batatas TaxID=748121 RepID=UPI001D05A322|nr:uncharacterized protein KVR01_006591 [Diaporthe batatas]KAG8163294.1 hypothetical protein KVR01_006591 [Diaporthe batatas]
MVSSLALLALASGALALKVTSPDSNTIWSTGEKQTIEWESVSSDESSFNIYLSNKATYPPTDVLLASDVQTSAGSIDVDGSKLSTGDSYTINLTNGTKTEQLYAQSNQFNITEGSSPSSASSTALASSTASSSSTAADSTAASSTASAASSSASATGTSSSSSEEASSTASSSSGSSSASGTATGSSSSSSSTSTSAATSGAGKIVASWVGVAALAALAL